MSPDSTAYLTDKCEVQNRDVTGGKAVYAREAIEPGELIAVWSGRIVSADELDELPPEIRRHTVQVEERLYLASLSAGRAARTSSITLASRMPASTARSPSSPCTRSSPAKRSPSTTPCATARPMTSSSAGAGSPLAAAG